MGYHYGLTIKKYRKMRGWTLAMLAEKWPKVNGSEGVNITYVQDIEAGRKRIADQETLRQLAGLLEIPLWEFGYSEYNPFAPDRLPGNGKRMFDETLDTIEHLIRDVWSLRCAARIVEAGKLLVLEVGGRVTVQQRPNGEKLSIYSNGLIHDEVENLFKAEE